MSRTVIFTGGSSGIGKALGAALVAQGPGQAGLVPAPLPGPYTMTKHALAGLTMSLRWRRELYRLSPRTAEAYGRSYLRWATEHMSGTRVPGELEFR